jgi:hypothetical protein
MSIPSSAQILSIPAFRGVESAIYLAHSARPEKAYYYTSV